jgi:N-acetylmuramoyl-L-alanine amidase
MISIDSTLTETSTPRIAGLPSLNSYPGYTDVRVTSGFAPFLIEQDSRQVTLTLYGLQSPSNITGGIAKDSMVTGITWNSASPTTASLVIALQQPLWGYKAFYDRDGAVVLRIRRPPQIDINQPLQGRRILIDPGHPPAGATGPTGLTEAQANLAIALKLAEKLRAKGANVIMTRTTGQAPRSMTNSAIDLWARTEIAVNNDAEVLLSVHNNAFPDGVNPFLNVSTGTYYFHPHSRDLARALQTTLLTVTGLPDNSARQKSLAVVRPTWMPAALTESLYMMFPEQEMLLRDPKYLDKLAEAHVQGLENFFRERAMQAQP